MQHFIRQIPLSSPRDTEMWEANTVDFTPFSSTIVIVWFYLSLYLVINCFLKLFRISVFILNHVLVQCPPLSTWLDSYSRQYYLQDSILLMDIAIILRTMSVCAFLNSCEGVWVKGKICFTLLCLRFIILLVFICKNVTGGIHLSMYY